MSIAALRTAHLLGARFAEEGGYFLLNLRQKGHVSHALLCLTWLLGLPFLAVCTAVGAMRVSAVE